MKLHPKLVIALWLGYIVLCFTLMFSITFWGTTRLYSIIGFTPPILVAEITNLLGSILLFSLVTSLVSRLFLLAQRRERRIYGPIIDALARIATGDFSVQVENIFDPNFQNKSVLDELIQSVNRMAQELNQMETMRQEFISNVSHEIQSPLTSINGFAQALHSDNLSIEKRNHYLQIIETECRRLSKLSDNLLKLASLEAEQVKFEPKPYRLDRQLRNLILTCEPQWTEKALDMDVSLEEVTITADEDLLNQTWLNLLHNSIKFTPPGGSISITLSRHNKTITCTIRDTGIGIAREDQLHIFERFYKADQARQRSKEGSGLGLSIVKKILEMHRGDIKVESTPGAGTTFFISLPIQPMQADV
ncbi:MAG TPA: HAMP domain-containing sensor histidine kinase [Ktedonosporobacter sp.]|nr:HAMP domain-containing sensor histidine kinase [Ktedonosporobacter sp.]